MKFFSLLAFVGLANTLQVGDNQVCNTLDGCIETSSKCCYATSKTSVGNLYNNLYCVPDGTPEITVAGNVLKVDFENCPKKVVWLPGATGNAMDGVGSASYMTIGLTSVAASLYAAM